MNIDFVEPKLPSRRAWMLASVPMAMALVLLSVTISLRMQLDAQRERMEAAELASKVPPEPPRAHRPAPAYLAEALAVIHRAALPEADALAELEHVEVKGIQLHSIDVNPAQSVVAVELDAVSDEALGDYLDQLNAGEGPTKWHIQRLASQTGERRVDAAAANGISQTSSGHVVLISRAL